jgi:large subunit ribosomal protein L14
MKGVKARVTKPLNVGSRILCADNTGAKTLEIISIMGYRGVKRRKPKGGVGDVIKASVKEGDVKLRKQIVDAVIIRQKKEYRRNSGTRVVFEDNAAVLINEKGEARGTQIKGPVAREAVERFISIGKIASTVV